MMKYLLGIDVGTTGTKTLLIGQNGQVLGSAYRSYPTDTPMPKFCEQNPEDWWNAVVETVREACADEVLRRNVVAISLSTQGGTMVATDENFQPIRPAIVWNDMRCTAQQKAFNQEVGDAQCMYEKTGWWLCGGLNALQIRWMRDNEPENFAKTRWFLSVPDYISAKFTGIPAVDFSNSGINQLVNIRRREYDDALLDFAGITREQLPKLVPSGEMIGTLTQEAANALGLSENCALVAGAHDQYAVALGAGACNGGDVLIGTGTAWVVTAIGDRPDFSSRKAQSVAAAPGKWGSLWSLASGGVCLDWLRKNVSTDYEPLNQEAAKRKAAEEGLFFFPFSGCSTENKNFTRGSFLGMDLSHDRYHLARAVMEGVAFQITWMLESFKPSSAGLLLAGGATKSPLWCQILADISGLPIRIPEVADLACVGAAVMAGTGCGIFETTAEGCNQLKVREKIIFPDPARVERYRQAATTYRSLAEKLGCLYGIE